VTGHGIKVKVIAIRQVHTLPISHLEWEMKGFSACEWLENRWLVVIA
jgi:hypothetical protein